MMLMLTAASSHPDCRAILIQIVALQISPEWPGFLVKAVLYDEHDAAPPVERLPRLSGHRTATSPVPSAAALDWLGVVGLDDLSPCEGHA
jgi:hypothetical protein